jgi:hypothetical protein
VEKVLGSIPSYSIFALVLNMDELPMLVRSTDSFAVFEMAVVKDSESRMGLPTF